MLRIINLAFILLIALPAVAENVHLAPAPYLTESEWVFAPEPQKSAAPALEVDTSNRAEVAAFYRDIYKPGVGANPNWTGSIATCNAGTTAAAYRDAVLQRVNYFRAMTGLPSVPTLDDSWNTKCQDAALMMIAEPGLSHNPGSDWACYTSGGKDAAGKSNLAIGVHGPASIDAYIRDDGSGNEPVGHRRWILFPPLLKIGTGDTDVRNGNFYGSNALWVIDGFGPRPPEPAWVAWPPSGNVPYDLVYPRWSFTYPSADYGSASVSVTGPNGAVAIQVYSPRNGYGDNTLVWEIQDPLPWKPVQDAVYSVSLTNVKAGGTKNFAYQVIIMDPDRTPATPTPTPAPTATPTPVPAGPADTNGDGVVDYRDLFTFAPTWGDTSGAAGYDSRCDLDGDGLIGTADVLRFLSERQSAGVD